jgi:futalosine hydrolase
MGIGDVAIAAEENDAHLGIEPKEEGHPPEPLPFNLGEMDDDTVGACISMDNRLTEEASGALAAGFFGKKVKIAVAPFVTVSTITATNHGAARLYERFQSCMENMEGIAGAHVAKHYGIPFLEIRCASNLVGKRDREAWDLPLACRRSAEAAVIWLRSRPRL